MKKETMNRIINNEIYNRRTTIIGAYTYRFDVNSGEIERCKTAAINRMWIGNDGRHITAWETVAQLERN